MLGSDLKAQAIDSLIADWTGITIRRRQHSSLHTFGVTYACSTAARASSSWSVGFRRRRICLPHRRWSSSLRQTGDQIVFLKNETSLGVKNGMIGRVVEAAPNRIVAAIGEGAHRRSSGSSSVLPQR